MRHVLVESIGGIAAAKAAGFGLETVWHSSSPAVIEAIRSAGEKAMWIEDSGPLDLADRVGDQIVDAIEALRPDLEKIADDLQVPEFVPVISLQMHQTLGAILYKQATLTRWREASGGGTVVGEPNLTIPPHGNISCDSFDTLYALLAAQPDNGIDVLEYVEARPNLRAIKDRPSLLGRFLSLADLSFAQIVWRILKYVMPNQRLGFSRKGLRILIMRENEIIREMLPYLLIKGASVEIFSLSAGKIAKDDPHPLVPKKARLEACLLSGRIVERNVKPVAAVLHRLLTEASRSWRVVAAGIQRNTARLANDGRPTILLSNTPPGIAGAAAIAALRRRGIRIVIAEHGVSAGLSTVYYAMRRWNEVMLADDYLVCSENARRFFQDEPRATRVRVHAAGLARQVRHVPLAPIQRVLVRGMLRAGRQRIVLYLARPEQNNQRRLPYSPHDRNVYELQKQIVCELLPKLYGCPVFKTYSTRRYYDASPLGDSLIPPDPVRVVSRGDFRYLRAAASVIILESFTSTFGYTFGAGVPVVILRQHGIDPLPNVEEHLLRSAFVFDTRKEGWLDELVSFLNQDQIVIDRLWADKAPAREVFLRDCVFGPQNAGRNGAEIVMTRAENSRSDIVAAGVR